MGTETVTETVSTATGKIRIWEKLEILVGEGSGAGKYVARLEDLRSGLLVISAPEFISGSSLLRNGADCTVIVTKEDAIYEFSSTITVVENQGRRTYLLREPERLRRVQRRQFVRIDLRRILAIALIGRKNRISESIAMPSWQKTTTVNISGGGMLIDLPQEMAAGDLILVKAGFFPEIGLPIAVAAVVRRVQRIDKTLRAGIELLRGDQLHLHMDAAGLKLLPESVTFFDQIAQNKLVNYVFREQVKLRQKGLL